MLELRRSRIRRRERRLRALVLTTLIVGSLPLCAFIGIALYRGNDVASGLRHIVRTYWTEPRRTALAVSEVPFHRPGRIEWLANLDDLELSEASGLAVSTRRPDLLWSHNDSGNPHDVYAVDLYGRTRGTLRVDNSLSGDWEDIASFVLDGQSYLLLGDVGDNLHWRRRLELVAVEEPPVPEAGLPRGTEAKVAWRVRFTYPEGPRDCEALAVDVESESVLLLTKRTVPSEVYRVPLRPKAGSDPAHVAERIAELDTLPQPGERALAEDSRYGPYRSQPTAFDIAGDLASVVTHGDAYLYLRLPGEAWEETLRRTPRRLALPYVTQREAGALSRDGRLLYVTSERGSGGAAGLFRVELNLPLGG